MLSEHEPCLNLWFDFIFIFRWILPIFFKGRKKILDQSDLFDPLKEHKSDYLGDKLCKAWDNEIKKKKALNKEPSLLSAGLKVFGAELALGGFLLFLLEIGIRMTQPIFIMGLVAYFANPNGNLTEGYLYAAGLIACSVINVIMIHPIMLGQAHLGMKLRIASISMIYRKALRLTQNSLGETTAGQVVNLLSNDVGRFETSILFINHLWIAPIELIAVSVILYNIIGVSSLLGVGFLLIFVPIQSKFFKILIFDYTKFCCFSLHGKNWSHPTLQNCFKNWRKSSLYEWNYSRNSSYKDVRMGEAICTSCWSIQKVILYLKSN